MINKDINYYYYLGKRDGYAECLAIFREFELETLDTCLKLCAMQIKDNIHAQYFLDKYKDVKIPDK